MCAHHCGTLVDEKQHIKYYQCERCQLVFKSPKNFQDFDEQKKRYDLHQNKADNEGYQAYFRRFLDFLLPLTGEVRNALDYGCGATSLLGTMLKEEGIACDSYDPIYRPDRSYREKTYDLIVSVEVFEHLHDPGAVFKHLLSRLNTGGYLAIQTQFHPNDKSQFLAWYYRLDPTHIVFFRPETFRYLAARHSCRYMGDNGKNMLMIQKIKKPTSCRSER